MVQAGPLLQNGQLLLAMDQAVLHRVVMVPEVFDFGQLRPVLVGKGAILHVGGVQLRSGGKKAAR